VVDDVRRQQISLNHSATHLLHAALRQVLGEHVAQKGSLVSDALLRFDFAHHEAIRKEQLAEVERIVNQQVRANNPVQTEVMLLDAAKAKGAMALFGEKYSEQVRVLTMGDFSIELCGGIHAKRTGDIGLFKIVTETAVAAGIRRIEAITGETAIEWLQHQQTLLNQSADLLKSDVNSITDKISLLQDKFKKVEKELQTLKEKAALQVGNDLAQSAVKIHGVSVIMQQLDGIEAKSLRSMVDSLKNQLGSVIVVFASVLDEKVNLIVGVTDDLTAKVKAGELVNLMAQQVGGRGGGRQDMAMAGGTQPENIGKALSVCSDWLKANL
jgi:alanine--tRNA ligase